MSSESESLFRPGWVIHLLPAVLSVAAAFVLGTLSMDPMPNVKFEWRDKVGHFFAFGFVAVTHIRAARFLGVPRRTSWQIGAGVMSASAAGGLLEIWQAFLPYRTAEWLDFVADAFGACAMGCGWMLLKGKRGPV